MSHTPGPWTINEWTQKDADIGIGAIGTPLVAKAMLRDVSVNDQQANARLIAAAPEMLELISTVAKTTDNWSLAFDARELFEKITGEKL